MTWPDKPIFVATVIGMDITAFEELLTPGGRALLEEVAAADVSETGLLATASHLRARYPAELVAAALTQVRLRLRAHAKFGADADRMFFTPAGLEQATRASVARHRARRFAAYLPADGTVLDLGCGIGGDLIARGLAGCGGVGIDRDRLTVAVARANLTAFGLKDAVTVREGDVTKEQPSGYAAIFADPGRRTTRGRVFDPEAYEPPLTTVLDLATAAPAGCVKVAPGIPHDAIPPGAEAEWISDGGEVKEAALWLGVLAGADPGLPPAPRPARADVTRGRLLPDTADRPHAGTPGAPSGASPGGRATGEGGVLRRATLLRDGREAVTLVAEPGLGPPPVAPWGRYLYEPDGAVVRAHLVGEVAAMVGGALADPRIAYITSDALLTTPFARAYRINDVMPFSVKRLRAALRERDIGTLTIKKRGFAGEIERLRRDLRPAGAGECVLVLTRVGDAPIALICDALSNGAGHQVQAEDTPP